MASPERLICCAISGAKKRDRFSCAWAPVTAWVIMRRAPWIAKARMVVTAAMVMILSTSAPTSTEFEVRYST